MRRPLKNFKKGGSRTAPTLRRIRRGSVAMSVFSSVASFPEGAACLAPTRKSDSSLTPTFSLQPSASLRLRIPRLIRVRHNFDYAIDAVISALKREHDVTDAFV